MQKSIIPILAVMCFAVTTQALSAESILARAGATGAMHDMAFVPCGCLWASYCAGSKTFCQSYGRRRNACGCGSRLGSACCDSSCTQEQYGCDAGYDNYNQHGIQSRPSTPAPRYSEPWPAAQNSFNRTQPAQNFLPQNPHAPRYLPADDLPQSVLPKNASPHNDLPTAQRRPRRLTVRQVSRNTAITTPWRPRHVAKSSPPVPKSAHQSPKSVHSYRRNLDQWKRQSQTTSNGQ